MLAAALARAQREPGRAGPGLGHLLHAQTGGPTIGCISLRRDELVRVLRWLRPGAKPHIAVGTSAQLRS